MHPDTSMTVRQFYTKSSLYTQVDITRIGNDDKLYFSGSVSLIPASLMDEPIHYIEATDRNHIHVVLK